MGRSMCHCLTYLGGSTCAIQAPRAALQLRSSIRGCLTVHLRPPGRACASQAPTAAISPCNACILSTLCLARNLPTWAPPNLCEVRVPQPHCAEAFGLHRHHHLVRLLGQGVHSVGGAHGGGQDDPLRAQRLHACMVPCAGPLGCAWLELAHAYSIHSSTHACMACTALNRRQGHPYALLTFTACSAALAVTPVARPSSTTTTTRPCRGVRGAPPR